MTDMMVPQRFSDRNQENRRLLVAAGRGDEVMEAIDRVSKVVSGAYRAIREDDSRTEDWKRRELASVYLSHREALDRKFDDDAAEIEARDARDAAAVIGVVGLAGDAAGLAISRRDAADRVATATGGDELREVMHQALRIGDEVLARAALDRALTARDRDTVDVFVRAHPRHADVVERLWSRRDDPTGTAMFMLTAALSGLIPAELTGMARGQIQSVSEGSA